MSFRFDVDITRPNSVLYLHLTTYNVSLRGFPNIQAMSGLLMDPLSPILKVNLNINIWETIMPTYIMI